MYNDEIPAKDIRRGKIIKYSLAALLGITLVGCSGIDIYDVDIDHTKEICLTTKIMDALGPNEEDMSIGIETHQIPEITEYANYNYETNTFDYQETINLSK